MPTLDITDDHADRIEALREELAATHAGPYASVDREDALAYLLDLADAVDDPERVAEPTTDDEDDADAAAPDDAASAEPFDRDRARELLSARNRRYGDPDPDDPMDLYDIAAAFDVTGRSEMRKAELVDAILDAAAELAEDPFAGVGVDVDLGEETEDEGDDDEREEGDADGESGADSQSDTDGEGDETDADTGNDGEGADAGAGAGDDDGDAGQLNAMMSLLDTHADKWREADGDARYEVDLPDGSVETARTKDDVRALLFRNY
jgi:hypothetical protein